MTATHPVEAAAALAAQKLLTLKFSKVVGEPDMTDAKNIVSDIEALWTVLDPLIEAMGDYAMNQLGISDKAMDGCHRNQVRGALEGNLTFLCEEAVRQDIADRVNDAFMGRVA